MQEQIKRCPFCGNVENDLGAAHMPPLFPGDSAHDYVYVQCLECGAKGPEFERSDIGRQKAIDAWNSTQRILKWQKTPPTEAGFYFYRNIFGCVYVLNFQPAWVDFSKLRGEWAGPIMEPTN